MEEIIKAIEEFFLIEGYEERKIFGRVLEPKEKNINSLKEVISQFGYLPFFRKEGEKEVIQLVSFYLPQKEKTEYLLPAILFLLTLFSTIFIGSLNRGGNPFISPKDLLLGLPFSFSLLLILGGHELGHYLTARRHGVSATLPHFLPIPHPLIGTMGAFIRIKSVIPSRKALIEVGLSGPLIGFLLAIPITIFGLAHSQLVSYEELKGGIGLGSSLLFSLLSRIFFPRVPEGKDILLHPMAFAGWLGFFVTAMNLLPLGQLDGGHIAYAVFYERTKIVRAIIVLILALLGLRWPGWYFWLILVFLFGFRHPPVQDEIIGLRRREKLLALLGLIIFLLSFTPFPFQTIP
jgi:membrane-associated protease RseP (regulator of RpoE activity)